MGVGVFVGVGVGNVWASAHPATKTVMITRVISVIFFMSKPQKTVKITWKSVQGPGPSPSPPRTLDLASKNGLKRGCFEG